MIKLPKPIQLSETIQPVKLSQNCFDTHDTGIDVYAAGIGQTYSDQHYEELDGLLRQAAFSTISRYYYGSYLFGIVNPNLNSVILTAPIQRSSLGSGDSGGSLFLQADQTLIGVARSTLSEASANIQLFTKVSYFYDWIAYETGLPMPKCQDEQAPIHA